MSIYDEVQKKDRPRIYPKTKDTVERVGELGREADRETNSEMNLESLDADGTETTIAEMANKVRRMAEDRKIAEAVRRLPDGWSITVFRTSSLKGWHVLTDDYECGAFVLSSYTLVELAKAILADPMFKGEE